MQNQVFSWNKFILSNKFGCEYDYEELIIETIGNYLSTCSTWMYSFQNTFQSDFNQKSSLDAINFEGYRQQHLTQVPSQSKISFVLGRLGPLDFSSCQPQVNKTMTCGRGGNSASLIDFRSQSGQRIGRTIGIPTPGVSARDGRRDWIQLFVRRDYFANNYPACEPGRPGKRRATPLAIPSGGYTSVWAESARCKNKGW